MGNSYPLGEEDAGGLRLIIDGTPIALFPRVAAMVRLLSEHQHEIERQATGQVTLDYAPWPVAMKSTVKLGLQKIDKVKEL